VLLLAGTAFATDPARLQAQPAPDFSVLHAFESGPSQPRGRLLQAPDGSLFGTTQSGGPGGNGIVFRVNPDGSSFTRLHALSETDGGGTFGGLISLADGGLYGTAAGGGANGVGTIFKLGEDGSGFTKLHDFDGVNGAKPFAGLVVGPDGALYGVTAFGGASGDGTVFRINGDGSGFTKLYEFDEATGGIPYSALLVGPDGAFYGTTYVGGSGNNGTVFKIETDGTGFATLHNFNGTDGAQPHAGLVVGPDAALYGATISGGSQNLGVLFKIQIDGSGFTKLVDLDAVSGSSPYGALLSGPDGALYGAGHSMGSFSGGTVFKLAIDGTGLTVLHDFDHLDGRWPFAGLVLGADGALYGSTHQGGFGIGTVFTIQTDGSNFAKLVDFVPAEGTRPSAPLVVGPDGAHYGTTSEGGTAGDGIVFKIAADGSGFTKLHDFELVNGANPYAGLVVGPDGALYGTTSAGGSANTGVVFKLQPDGSAFSKLHDFDQVGGAMPYGDLVVGPDSALYGTTAGGGGSSAGTVFRIDTSGAFTKLHDFDGTSGASPIAGLLVGADGALYGTTSMGGLDGRGVVFKLGIDGSGFATLHDFDSGSGSHPRGSLVTGLDGALYGTTSLEGANAQGTVFKLTPDGVVFSKLHDFDVTSGASPYGGLVVGPDNALYGTTRNGGSNLLGIVFRINHDGSGFSKVLDFASTTGSNPEAPLIIGSDGAFHGTARWQGAAGGGTVFRLPSELLVNGGFEGGSCSPWVASGTGFSCVTTGPSPHTGAGYARFAGNKTKGRIHQDVTIPTTASGSLTLWINIITGETTTKNDKLFIEVRNTSNALLATLGSLSNLDQTGGLYVQRSYSLALWRGQTIRLSFRHANNNTKVTQFMLDDISVK
jgi:uncharacterized repeat protein (TIGR03803 family)